jgi:hypothetical protein
VIICPLSMGQEIDDAMSEHADKTGHRRFIEHRRQRKEGTDDYERMQTDRHGMQQRVVQECNGVPQPGQTASSAPNNA